VKLTDKTVAGISCPEGKKDVLVFDDALSGFGVRVTASGKRSFLLQYRSGGQVRRIPLGSFGTELTTAQARKKAETLRGQVVDQRDPVAERRAALAKAREEEAAAKAAKAAAVFTVDVLITQWTEHHLAHRSESYRLNMPRMMRQILKPWLSAPAGTLARADAVHLLDQAASARGPIAANRFRAVARACWAWAVKRGSLEVNPWEATPRPGKETSRTRVLTDAEIGDLWNAAGGEGEPWPALIRLMLLTGQRRGEVAGMRWDELDLDTGQWRLPGSRTKNGRPHIVPLSEPAVAILRGVRRGKGAVLVFRISGDNPPSGFGKVKDRLHSVMTTEAKKAKRKVEPWTLHDVRRTVATGLQRLGVRLEVTEAVLNHVSGSRAGIVGVYQLHGWDKEKAEALKAWAAHVLACAEAKTTPSNVVPLVPKAG